MALLVIYVHSVLPPFFPCLYVCTYCTQLERIKLSLKLTLGLCVTNQFPSQSRTSGDRHLG